MAERFFSAKCSCGNLFTEKEQGVFTCESCGAKWYKVDNYFVDDEYVNECLTIKDGVLTEFKKDLSKKSDKSAYVPSLVKVIGEHAFDNTPDLDRLVLAEGVEEIESNALLGHTLLRKVVFPASLIKIGDYAFSGTIITRLRLLEGLKHIGDYAFKDCVRLYKNYLPSTLSYIGEGAFEGCYRIPYLNFGAKEASSGWHKEYDKGCKVYKAWKNRNYDDFYEENNYRVEFRNNADTDRGVLLKYDGDPFSVHIPDYISKIAPGAFKGVKNIYSIEIPDTVEEIGESAFEDCENLGTVIIEGGCKKIGAKAFKNTKITSLDIPNTVQEIGAYAFAECRELTYVFLEEGLTNIGDYMFLHCNKLDKINKIPSSIKSIGKYAFCHCEALTDIALPDGIENLGEDIFACCYSLKNVKLPENLTVIPRAMFYDCKALTEYTIPEGITTIEQNAFAGSALTEITIPEGVTSIGERAFSCCKKLRRLKIASTVTKIGKEAFAGSFLDNLYIPNGVEEIGDSAFSSAFASIQQITIPQSVKKLGEKVFYRCNVLNFIYVEAKNYEEWNPNWLVKGEKKAFLSKKMKPVKHKIKYAQ